MKVWELMAALSDFPASMEVTVVAPHLFDGAYEINVVEQPEDIEGNASQSVVNLCLGREDV